MNSLSKSFIEFRISDTATQAGDSNLKVSYTFLDNFEADI